MPKIIQVAILVILTIAVFANTFNNSFNWDDTNLITKNKYIHNLKNIPLVFKPAFWNYLYPGQKGGYRPLFMISCIVDYFLWGNNTFGYHLTNLIFHVADVLLVYFFALVLTASYEPRGGPAGYLDTKHFLSIPFIAAVLFAVNPIHTESVTWIKNRGEPMALLFCILAFIIFIKLMNKELKLPRIMYLLSVLSFACAMLFKEVAATLPILLVAYIICMRPRKELRSGLLRTLSFFGVVFLYLLFKALFLKGDPLLALYPKIGFYPNLLSVFKTFGYYLALLICPFNLNAERLFAIPHSILEPAVIFSIAALSGVLIIIALSFKRHRLLAFSLLWTIIAILPVSNIFFLRSRPIAEQRLYIPSVGFCMVLAMVLNRLYYAKAPLLPGRYLRSFATGSFIFITFIYSAGTIARNADWRDPLTLWRKTVESAPANNRVLYNLANAYLENKMPDEAITYYKKRLQLVPNDVKAMNNLGNAYTTIGENEKAIESWKRAIEIYPRFSEAYNNMGALYESVGRPSEAIEFHKKAIEIDPEVPISYHNLAVIYVEYLKKYEEAIELYKKAIALGFDEAQVYYNLGIAYTSCGRYDEAIECYKKAIARKSDFAQAYNNMAMTYYFKKDLASAGLYVQKAKSLGLMNKNLLKAIGLGDDE